MLKSRNFIIPTRHLILCICCQFFLMALNAALLMFASARPHDFGGVRANTTKTSEGGRTNTTEETDWSRQSQDDASQRFKRSPSSCYKKLPDGSRQVKQHPSIGKYSYVCEPSSPSSCSGVIPIHGSAKCQPEVVKIQGIYVVKACGCAW